MRNFSSSNYAEIIRHGYCGWLVSNSCNNCGWDRYWQKYVSKHYKITYLSICHSQSILNPKLTTCFLIPNQFSWTVERLLGIFNGGAILQNRLVWTNSFGRLYSPPNSQTKSNGLLWVNDARASGWWSFFPNLPTSRLLPTTESLYYRFSHRTQSKVNPRCPSFPWPGSTSSWWRLAAWDERGRKFPPVDREAKIAFPSPERNPSSSNSSACGTMVELSTQTRPSSVGGKFIYGSASFLPPLLRPFSGSRELLFCRLILRGGWQRGWFWRENFSFVEYNGRWRLTAVASPCMGDWCDGSCFCWLGDGFGASCAYLEV